MCSVNLGDSIRIERIGVGGLTISVDRILEWHEKASAEAANPPTEKVEMAIIQEEYGYWRSVDSDEAAAVCIGAIGALANVMARAHGLIPRLSAGGVNK